MVNIGNVVEEEVQRTFLSGPRPEDQLFGKFFANVDKCRLLMKEKQVLASGSAVLHALQGSPSWVPSDLDLFVSSSSLGELGLLEWHEYLRSEGYSLVPATVKRSYSATNVSRPVVLKVFY
ncbi:uncharacterized protein N7479_001713 [Penicillium vulpinum]|uniref:uncharacterized protein n=1 Tax=Penicillium vulpinum TaxID=29845 RepID=UPI0025479FBF|nr:uncharacterized protein N7479_001713 [Penicillium vulpinum]KAJ5971795.1 hypothetical protein N7479_001713 [Penicillium vulpinum]